MTIGKQMESGQEPRMETMGHEGALQFLWYFCPSIIYGLLMAKVKICETMPHQSTLSRLFLHGSRCKFKASRQESVKMPR